MLVLPKFRLPDGYIERSVTLLLLAWSVVIVTLVFELLLKKESKARKDAYNSYYIAIVMFNTFKI